jgi:hypothetical protein
MFPALTDRLAGAVLMGLDVAVEFATLGEFRLVDPDLPASSSAVGSAAPLARRPQRSASQPNRSILPGPATAAARATGPEPGPVLPVPPVLRGAQPAPRTAEPVPDLVAAVRCGAGRRRHPADPARQPARPAKRKRAGAVQPPAQLCLL